VLDLSAEVEYHLEKTEGKAVVTMKTLSYPRSLKRHFLLKKPGIEKLSFQPLPDGTLEMVMTLSGSPDVTVFSLPEIEEKKPRIVVDVRCPELEIRESQERERVKTEETRKKIVVIDPGHGGDDPGAVGRNGTYEKNVALSIARRLRDNLNAREGYRAFLTREGDYYVSFQKRLKIAREYGADLFVSIHADAARSRKATGTSVYCLSLRGASSEAARILARKENLADIVGGTANGEKGREESEPIVLNMVQTNTINASKTFGNHLLKHLSRLNTVKYQTVQEAPFMVLKLPDIPSVLVETAYISNPKEEKRLRSPRFQRELADAVAAAVVLYFDEEEKLPPVLVKEGGKDKEERRASSSGERRFLSYKVKRGDRLEVIARVHDTPLASLMAVNRIKDKDKVLVGQVLRIPQGKDDDTAQKHTDKAALRDEGKTPSRSDEAVETRPKRSGKVILYKVKRGDSMEGIARAHGTTIAAIAAANGRKNKDRVLMGETLKIPVVAKGDDGQVPRTQVAVGSKGAPKEGGRKSDKNPAALAIHVVKKGESLDYIARRRGTTVAFLRELNGIKEREPLYVGRKIKVPKEEKAEKKGGTKRTGGTFHVVKKGDTLEMIARRHGITMAALKKANTDKHLEPLYVNQRLRIPGS
ncbi:MAG: N-acetylmuramoyl-L-alanine amidase, partial [Syntrophales bacterium]|nr:N-acetylmuramoyl-L-alanine amidase [Syntrophales bacterium]